MTLNRAVVAMCAAQACAQIGAFSVAALLPTLIAVWSLSNTEAGWISGIYYAAYTLVVPFLSSLTDRVDPKRVYLGSVGLTAVAFAGLVAVATGFWSALAFRALMGAGWAGSYMPGLKALSDLAEGPQQSRAVADARVCRRLPRPAGARRDAGSAGRRECGGVGSGVRSRHGRPGPRRTRVRVAAPGRSRRRSGHLAEHVTGSTERITPEHYGWVISEAASGEELRRGPGPPGDSRDRSGGRASGRSRAGSWCARCRTAPAGAAGGRPGRAGRRPGRPPGRGRSWPRSRR